MSALVDTSVWIEFLRGTGSRGDLFLVDTVAGPGPIWTGPVLGEVLAGASPTRAAEVERMIGQHAYVAVDPLDDFVWAADAYRRVRRSGQTVRSYVDCVIASVAVRVGVPVAHRDGDFEAIAGCTDLSTVDLR